MRPGVPPARYDPDTSRHERKAADLPERLRLDYNFFDSTIEVPDHNSPQGRTA